CRPMTALDADAAAALLRAGGAPPDVLIVDSHFDPRGSGCGNQGHRVIAALRALAGDDLPAAIVTGDTTPDRLKALAGLGFPVLHKPIQPGKLASLIRHMTRRRRSPEAAATPSEFA
ncbi:MAG TPA: response regulator, partial [Thalassobaculum sp.]